MIGWDGEVQLEIVCVEGVLPLVQQLEVKVVVNCFCHEILHAICTRGW
jgi:hypothetical protein